MKALQGKVTACVLASDGLNDRIVIQGWAGSVKKEKIDIFVRDEKGNELPFKLQRVDAGDLDMGLLLQPDDFVTLKGYRFDLFLKDAPKDMKKIHIGAKGEEKEIVMFTTTMRRLRDVYDKYVQQLFVESWTWNETEARVRGWCFHKTNPFNLEVFNADGEKLPAEMKWERRLDIERIYLISNPDKKSFGYEAVVSRERIIGDKLTLVLSSGNKKVIENIHLSKEKKPEKKNSLLLKLISPKRWIRALLYLKKYGFDALINRAKHADDNPEVKYQKWFLSHRVTKAELEEQRKVTFQYQPKISIVIPLYNTKQEFLKALLDSVCNQSYANWELCLADGSTSDDVETYIKANYPDERIRYERLKENKGISENTNAAIEMATGDFVLFSDHDDVLEEDALFEIVKYYNENPTLDIIYTDEDLTDEIGEKFSSPRFKPDFNPDFLQSINYICHIFCVKKEIVDAVGGLRSVCDGAQDWDFILRCTEQTEHIGHIPKVLYHWRAHNESTAGNADSKQYAIDAGRKALEDHFERIGEKAELDYTDIFVMFRAKLFPKGEPKVSIIIPNKDEKESLKKCIDSIIEKTTYKNYEIIIVENNSTSEEIFEYYKELENGVVRYTGDFNYSKINNFGATHATGDYLVLLNNDTEVISPDWLERMLGYCQRENTGIVGAKLYFPDDTVQNCGIVVGIGGFAGSVLTGCAPTDTGYFGRLKAVQDISAVTAACLMIKRSVYDEVGGLDEDFVVALNDVDLCLKVRALNKRVVLDPGVELYHFESKSRGMEESEEKHERFKNEIVRFREKWKSILEQGDPYYNKNLTLMYEDFRLRASEEHFAIIDEIQDL